MLSPAGFQRLMPTRSLDGLAGKIKEGIKPYRGPGRQVYHITAARRQGRSTVETRPESPFLSKEKNRRLFGSSRTVQSAKGES